MQGGFLWLFHLFHLGLLLPLSVQYCVTHYLLGVLLESFCLFSVPVGLFDASLCWFFPFVELRVWAPQVYFWLVFALLGIPPCVLPFSWEELVVVLGRDCAYPSELHELVTVRVLSELRALAGCFAFRHASRTAPASWHPRALLRWLDVRAFGILANEFG